jgi:hypothetical protein
VIKDPRIQDPKRIKRSYVRKDRSSIYERFHNYGVKFRADVFWDAIFEDPIRLNNNVFYKRLDFPLAIVKVFKKSILVTLRSSEEIKGLDVKSAEKLSYLKVNEVLDLLPKSIKVLDRSVVNVHNAFVNHPTARHDVKVVVNDQVRLISDRSKGHLEFETVSPDHAISDSEILEKFNEDLIVNNPDPLSIQGSKINHVVEILDRYALQMELHLEVEEKTSRILDRIGASLDRLVDHKVKSKPKRSLGMTSPRCHR